MNDIFAEEKLSWTPEAMMQTKSISDVEISPDNESVLFVVRESKKKDEKWVLLFKNLYKLNKDRYCRSFFRIRWFLLYASQMVS